MKEALKLALEALKTIDEAMPFPVAKLAQAAIKEALAQPEQEPVAMWDGHHQVEFGNLSAYKLEKSSWIPLYTTLTLPEQEPDYKEALRVLSLALEEAPTNLTPKQRDAWMQSKSVLLSGGGMA